MLKIGIAALLAAYVSADCYLHMPKGSNNRLNEQSANRRNGNRLFDSQNNNRGGHNVGDLDETNGFEEDTYIATFSEMYDFHFIFDADDDTDEKQYEMLYFENTILSSTWTNQHGTGNAKLNSHIVLQFTCDTVARSTAADANNGCSPNAAIDGAACDPNNRFTGDRLVRARELRMQGLETMLYNGGNTDTPEEPDEISDDDPTGDIVQTFNDNFDDTRGRREGEAFYSLCQSRKRNRGLFHADQNLNSRDQTRTRQNPGGTRRGLECPEERDYYPWWNPSPFRDIAIITHDLEYCEAELAAQSQNIVEKFGCVRPTATYGNDPANYLPSPDYVDQNLDATACTEAGGEYRGFVWGGAANNAPRPECVNSYWSKVNHLGNVETAPEGGRMATYDWTIPSVEDLEDKFDCYKYTYTMTESADDDDDYTQNVNCARLMFRIRYNMSTSDYDPYGTNSSQDYDEDEGIISPIEQNPEVDIGAWAGGLRLAINTAQTGRTFQDNTHTFLVCERPADASAWSSRTVFNVNVRGKRGNIVQTFPAIEYDFQPQHMEIEPGQCMHFQWEGSNTHNNGNPAGDGQAGDAGEGRGGSDRSNCVQSKKMDESYPVTYDKLAELQWDDFFDYVDCYHPLNSDTQQYPLDKTDAQIILGTAGFYRSEAYAVKQLNANEADQNDPERLVDKLLNNVSGAFRQGLICCVKSNALNGATGGMRMFSFISTRNNNFTNRSQKFKLIITNEADSSATN